MDEDRPPGTTPDEDPEKWAQFLRDEGLELLAIYRSIQNPDTRLEFVRLMREAARTERHGRS